MTTGKIAALICALSMSACAQTSIGEFDFPEGVVQHAVHADKIEWKVCPPNLPSSCTLAVLEGNPQEAGLFTVRFKVGGNFVMPAHTHPRDERVTVISGQMSVAFGANTSREDATQFGAGDYYVNSRDAVHSVWSDTDSEIQITGIGPWEAHFIE